MDHSSVTRWQRGAQAPASAPDFAFSHPTRSVRTRGVHGTFTSWEAANDALSRQLVPLIVGALPFDLSHPAALTAPAEAQFTEGPLEPPAFYRGLRVQGEVTSLDPSPEQHSAKVSAALRTMSSTALEKVVLARRVTVTSPGDFDPRLIAARLMDASPNGEGFLVDLSAAGPDFAGRHLVGASPEVLVARTGRTVTAFPLAGSRPRTGDPEVDARTGAALAADAKNLAEHAFVTAHLARVLTPLCEPGSLTFPKTPQLHETKDMLHLATPFTGTLRDDSLTALELATLVHPTPAIGGTPTELATAVIEASEGDRRFYSGSVGWCDQEGNGMFVIAIRCAEISADHTEALAWAGGGIVADSSPDEEVAETSAKLATVLRALGARLPD